MTASEVNEGQRWDEAKLKQLAGGDRVTAHFMKKDEFTFEQRHKLMLSGNHRPRLRTVDEAIKSRLHMVPFTMYFPEEKQDKKLKEIVRTEGRGILQWAVEGCMKWQEHGLQRVDAVESATNDYLDTQDVMKQWLDGATVKPTGTLNSCDTRSSELYHNYRRWAEARGEYALPQKDFSPKLETYGYKKVIKKGTPYFRDIALRLESGGGGGEGEPVNSPKGNFKQQTHPKGVNRMTSTTSTPLKSPSLLKFAGPQGIRRQTVN